MKKHGFIFGGLFATLICSFIVWIDPSAARAAAEFFISACCYFGLLVFFGPIIDDVMLAMRTEDPRQARARNGG